MSTPTVGSGGIPLHNDHNVYILGAGFSREANLPLISDFLLRMRDGYDWLIQQKRFKEASAVAKVLEFRSEATSAAYWVNMDLENIEELFSLASAGTGGIVDQIRLAIAATIDFCHANSRSRPVFVAMRSKAWEEMRAARPEYSKWLKLNATNTEDSWFKYEVDPYSVYTGCLLGMLNDGKVKGENTFITFNYDTLLEEALQKLGLTFDYGFKSKTFNVDKSFSYAPDAGAISVLKLHGSLNWARRTNKQHGRKFTLFPSYEEVKQQELIPDLIPPTWKKVFKGQLESVWGDAIKKLATATRIVVIGFSMPPTDMHFKYLVASGLRNNMSLRQIVFVNKASKASLEPRVKELLRNTYLDSDRIVFVEQSLHNFSQLRGGLSDNLGLTSIGRPFTAGSQLEIYGS